MLRDYMVRMAQDGYPEEYRRSVLKQGLARYEEKLAAADRGREAAQQADRLPEGREEEGEEAEEAELVCPERVRGPCRDPRHPRVRAAAQDAGRGRQEEPQATITPPVQ